MQEKWFHKALKGRLQEDEARLLSVVLSWQSEGSGHKQEHKKFNLNMRRNLISRVTALE